MKSATSFGSFLRTYCAIGAAVSLMAILQTQVQTQALLKLSTRYKWAILIVLLALNAAVGFYVLLHRKSPAPFWENWQLAQAGRLSGLLAGLGLVVLAPILLLYARADFFGKGVEAFFRLLWLFWWIALAQAAGLRLVTGIDWPRALSAALLLDGLAAQLFTLGTAVSNYPFSMGWSEASRYYYGSLIFSKSIYGQTLPLSVMHGSRYLLQSIPFVLRGVQLWAARLWQVVLWTGLTLGASAAVIRRLGKRRPIDSLLAGGWLFLFFFQGAVYYHLQVCVIIILLGVRSGHPWRSLAAVAAASFWAGMSRVNWFPVPAMLAITLYLLERKVRDSHGILDYMRTPALWGGVGLFFAAAGQVFYVTISGNTNLEAFASSFNSALLWYRWLPSPTNPIGIVPGVLIVSAPVIALLLWRRRAERGGMHTLREIGLGLILLILGAGGLVVSTKIGGGGDLHNMDAYLVVLAILGAYGLWGGAEIEAPIRAERRIAPWSVTAALALVPVAFALLRLGGPFSYDATRANADLATLAQEVRTYGKGGEVLFMYERHLQTFGLVPRVPMIADYEVVTLMEMAISGNRTYLNKYYDDLRTHRFAAIVAHPQNLGVETGDFIEENDAWNRLVGQPLLCQYKPAITLDYSNIQVLIPRARPCPAFPPKSRNREEKSWSGLAIGSPGGDGSGCGAARPRPERPRRMRVLIINSEYPPVGAGAGNASANIAQRLEASGNEVVVVTAGHRGLPQDETVRGVRVLRGPTNRRLIDRSTASEQVAFILGATTRCLGLVSSFHPDVVLAFFGLPSGAVAWFLKLVFRIPYVVSLRGGDVPGFRPYDFWLYHRIAVPFLRVIWHGASGIVANSKGLRELAGKFDPNAKIAVIPNGVDLERFQTARRNWSAPKILSAGRAVHQKGLDIALAALAGLKDLPWEWRVAGDGPQLESLKAMIAREGVQDRVRLLGWQSADDLVEEYRGASLFVFPSRHEGMPNAVLEAMASGLPVVASRIAGNEELVVPGETGFLVPPEDPDALRDALRQLLTDEGRRERMGRAGQARVATHYNWSTVAREYELILEKAAA